MIPNQNHHVLNLNQKVRNLKPMLSDTANPKESLIRDRKEAIQKWQMEMDFWQEEFNLLQKLYLNLKKNLPSEDDKLGRTFQELTGLISDKMSPLKDRLTEYWELLNNRPSDLKEAGKLKQQLEELQLAYRSQKLKFLEGLYQVIPISFF